MLELSGFRQENFVAPGRWRLSPRHCNHIAVVSLSLGIGNGKFDDEVIWPDLRPDDMFVNENSIRESRRVKRLWQRGPRSLLLARG